MKKRRLIVILLSACFVLLIWAKGQHQLTYDVHQESKLCEESISINHGNSTTSTSSFNIIILSSNGSISPLQRLVEALNDTTYYHQDVNLWIHINENNDNTENEDDIVYNWAKSLISTTVSFNSIHIAKNELHTDIKWLNDTWKPTLDNNEHGIILHDSISLSPLWYNWIMHMYRIHDNQDNDIAGYSLERIQTSTHAPEVPFLYSLAGNAFAIKSSIWRDFVEWSACSLCLGIMNTTSNEEQTQPMWKHYFAKFIEYHHKLYFVYEIPNNNRALAIPYDTNSQISTQLVTNVNDLQSKTASRNCNRYEKNELIRYDHNMNPVMGRQKQSVMVISTAVGDNYREISQFETFVGSLRKYYKGRVSLLISAQASDAVKEYLTSQEVEYEITEEGRRWQDFNVFRFIFYSNACITDVCLVVDFRDVKFQSNPFPSNLFGIEKSKIDDNDLIVFAHNLILHKHQRGGRWFHKHLPDCISFKDHEVPPTTSPLINAGGLYASQLGLATVRDYIIEHAECNDQITLNMLIHSDIQITDNNGTERLLRTTTFKQGFGAINNVAFNSQYTLDSLGRVGGWDCFLSPIVHQYDRLFQSKLMNGNCE